ncbi:hypothetical protein BC830DRAFT_1167623 [Chytriomyces sp. MP71]|nr:hypothetical protein BC830DRAFT_1167623 [Chytriomyces sp. MP71]
MHFFYLLTVILAITTSLVRTAPAPNSGFGGVSSISSGVSNTNGRIRGFSNVVSTGVTHFNGNSGLSGVSGLTGGFSNTGGFTFQSSNFGFSNGFGFNSNGFMWNNNLLLTSGFINSIGTTFRLPQTTTQSIIFNIMRIQPSVNIFTACRTISTQTRIPIIVIIRITRLTLRHMRMRRLTTRTTTVIIILRTISTASFVRRVRPTRVIVIIQPIMLRIRAWSVMTGISVTSWTNLFQTIMFNRMSGVWGKSGLVLNGGSWSNGDFTGGSTFDSTWQSGWGSMTGWFGGVDCCGGESGSMEGGNSEVSNISGGEASSFGGDTSAGSSDLFNAADAGGFAKAKRDEAGDATSNAMQLQTAQAIDAIATLPPNTDMNAFVTKYGAENGMTMMELAGLWGEVVNMMMDENLSAANMPMMDACGDAAAAAGGISPNMPEQMGMPLREMKAESDGMMMDGSEMKEGAKEGSDMKVGVMAGGKKEEGAAKEGTKEDGGAMEGTKEAGGAMEGNAMKGGAMEGGKKEEGTAMEGAQVEGAMDGGMKVDGMAIESGAMKGGKNEEGMAMEGGKMEGTEGALVNQPVSILKSGSFQLAATCLALVPLFLF